MAARETLIIEVRADGTRIVTRQIQDIGRQAAESTRGLYLLQRAMRTLGIGALTVELARLSDSFTNVQNRLAIVTKDSQELKAVMNELFDISRRTRTGFEQNAELFNRLALSTRGFGLSQKEVLGITETLNKAVIASGLGVREANNAIIQLSQGMSAGRLNGDELRSVLEQLGPVADIIAKEMGVTRGALRQLGREGKITTGIIIRAFQNAREEINDRFGKTIPTVAQSFTILRNAVVRTIGEFNAFVNSSKGISVAILFIADNLQLILKVLAPVGAAMLAVFTSRAIIGGILMMTRAVVGLTAAIAANPIGALLVLVTAAATALYMFADNIQLVRNELATLGDFGRAGLEAIGPLLSSMAGAILGAFGSLGQKIKEIYDSINVRDVIVRVAQELDRLNALAQGTYYALLAVWSGFPAAFADLFIQAVNGAIFAVRDFVSNLITQFTSLPTSVAPIFQMTAGELVTAFWNVLSQLARELPSTLAQIGRIAVSAVVTIFNGATSLIVQAWNGLPDALKDVIISAANGVITVFEDMINNTITAFASLPAELGRYVGEAVDYVVALFQGLIDGLKNLPAAIGELFRAAMAQAKKWVIEGLNSIIGWFNTIPGVDLGQIVADAGDVAVGALGKLGTAVDEAKKKFTKLNKEGVTVLNLPRITNEYEGAAMKLVDKVSDTINSGFKNNNKGAATELGNRVREGFIDGFNGAGKPVEGAVNDILRRADEIARDRKEAASRGGVDLSLPTPIVPPTDLGGSGAADKAAKKALADSEKRKKVLTDINTELQHEYDLLQLTGRERDVQAKLMDIQDKLRKSGIVLAEQEYMAIEKKVRALEALKSLSETISSGVDIVFDGIGSTLQEFITTGKADLGKMFMDIAGQLGKLLADELVFKPLKENLTNFLTQSLGGAASGAADAFGGASEATSAAGLTAAGTSLTAAGGTLTAAGGSLTASGGALTAAGGGLTASGGAITAAGGTLTASGGTLTASGGTLTAAGGSLTAAAGALTAAAGSLSAGAALGGIPLPGFAHGSSFRVGGNGQGVDKNLVAFKATRGEHVNVMRPGQKMGGATTVNVYNSSGAKATTQTKKGVGGNDIVEVFIERSNSKAATDISRGNSDINLALERRYGLNPAVGNNT